MDVKKKLEHPEELLHLRKKPEVYRGVDELPSGSAPDTVTEGCLVLEGGAWRGIYSQGALDALMEEGINFQTTIGISAGAMSGVGYVSGQIGWAPRINLTYRHDPNYCGHGAMRRDHGITGFSYLFDDLLKKHPLDIDRFYDKKRRFVVAASNLERGRLEYFEKGKCPDIFLAVQASATVPYISRPVEMNGMPYLDGGMITKIPYHWAKRRKFSKIMVIRTRDRSFRREEKDTSKKDALFYHKYPNLLRAMKNTLHRYNNMLDEIDADEKAGKIFVLAPKDPVEISRFEGDMDKLGELYHKGYHEMKEAMPQLKAYLNRIM